MSSRTLPGGSRRWLTAAGIVTLLIATTTGCYGTWGVRESYRQYTQSPFSEGGAITTEAGATWLDAAGPAKGPFQWTVASAQLDPTAETGFIQFSGGVKTSAHVRTGGSLLDISFWNPRLELDGDTATLVVDLNYRPYVGLRAGHAAPARGRPRRRLRDRGRLRLRLDRRSTTSTPSPTRR